MKRLQQLIRTLIFALALLVLGISHLLGDDPEQPEPVSDQQAAAEGVAWEDLPSAEDFSTELPGVPADELTPEDGGVESPISDPNIEPTASEPATSNSGLPFAETQEANGDSESSFIGDVPEIAQEDTCTVGTSADAASETVAGSPEPNQTSETSDCLSGEAPYPDITEFPVPAAAFYDDPASVPDAELASSWEDDVPLDNVTPAEYTADCECLVEKLDRYRNAQSGTEPQRFQETSPLVEVPQVPLGSESAAPIETSRWPIYESTPYTEAPSIAEPGTLGSNQITGQQAVGIPSEQASTDDIQQASATSLGPMIEPNVLVPPATIVPQSPLNRVLDQRMIAAVYGIFVGVLATLFLLLIGLILRSLVNRMMPRSAAANAGSSATATLQDPAAPAQQEIAGAQPPVAMPPHAQYVPYPHQQAYMQPVMMHPSFVYGDVDPREQDRPRRPKSSKSKAKRRRRTNATSTRGTKKRANPPSPIETMADSDSSTNSGVQSFELDSFDKNNATVSETQQVHPGVYTKILEQNLQLRNKDGA